MEGMFRFAMTDRSLLFDTRRRWHAAKHLSDLALWFLHLIGYYVLLRRPGTRLIHIAGFRLTIRPTVYDPRFYRAPAFFAEFIGGLNLSGKVVADLFTGSGIQALAAGRAGAARVFAIDVNPIAAVTAAENARNNGLADQVVVLASDLLSAIAAEPRFDVILANPPFCEGEAWDVADRAWQAGPAYRDIISLFDQAYRRLTPNGVMYMVNSSYADLTLLEELITQAGFRVKVASRREVFMETMIIYELRPTAVDRQAA